MISPYPPMSSPGSAACSVLPRTSPQAGVLSTNFLSREEMVARTAVEGLTDPTQSPLKVGQQGALKRHREDVMKVSKALAAGAAVLALAAGSAHAQTPTSA